MGRPPLPLGTAGKFRFYGSGEKWIARCGFRDYDGVTRTMERSGPSRAAAERALKTAIRNRAYRNRGADIDPDTRIKDVAESWWKVYCRKKKVGLNTLYQYRRQLDSNILPSVGYLKCRELSISIAENFLLTTEDEHGAAVAKTARSVLSNICSYAARLDAMSRNPVRETTPISVTPKNELPVSLDAEEFWRLRDAAVNHPRANVCSIVELTDTMAATGSRIGECLALITDDVCLEAKTVTINGTIVDVPGMGVVIKRQPKSKAGQRTLTLPDWAMSSVSTQFARAEPVTVTVFKDPDTGVEYLIFPDGVASRRRKPAEWLQRKLDKGTYSMREVALLLPAPTGRLWAPEKACTIVKKVFVAAGIPEGTSHMIRKTVATHMDDAGYSARVIADQLGHSRPSMTQDIYMGRSRISTEGAVALAPLGFEVIPPRRSATS
ncbi:tyrosine-type recombinase/integrase [Actinoplanes aureus]|uniref:Site-specific integrase n=1 Tax=Actinoplanes aureus TaxID=2792083 RepID=A0A931G190_9ACTN|nr:site-specific integrase [Actinoplanes aureus]MBG0564886.1 site-specific integrase [Actinoplanes aureus]MBG0569103.1 site-specific integrase [Actinoplanes aureus]